MTAKEPQGSQILRDQFAAWVLMTVHHGELCAASLLSVLKERMKEWTDRQAGAQQSLHVTPEDKILYVMPRKTGKGGPPLLLKNRRRLCFPDAWLRAAALQHVLGRLLPAKGDCLSGALCLVGYGDDGKLCFTRGPQQISSSEHPWQVVPPNQAPDVPPLHCSLAAWGVSPRCPLLVSCRALSCQPLFPDVSLCFSPCLAALLKISGSKYPTASASGLPQDLRGGRDSPFLPSHKVLSAAWSKGRRRLVRAQPLLYNLFPATINNLGESHFKGKGWRRRGGLGTERDRGVPLPDPTPALCINK